MSYSAIVEGRVERLKKLGGEVYKEAAKQGDDLAAIGQNRGVHFVMYPDDTVARFEIDQEVKYKPGWKGPKINDPESVKKRKEREFSEHMSELAIKKQAQRKSRKKVQNGDSDANSLEAKRKLYDIEIPPTYQESFDMARPGFDFFFEEFGPIINKKIGDSTREKENWSDPEYILDAVESKLLDYVGREDSTGEVDGNGPACSPDEWQEFLELPKPYKLALAYQYMGALPYED